MVEILLLAWIGLQLGWIKLGWDCQWHEWHTNGMDGIAIGMDGIATGMDGIAAGIDGNASGMDGIWMASRWHGWGEVRWQFCPKQESAAAAVMPTGVQCTSKLDYCKAAGARFCTTVQSAK